MPRRKQTEGEKKIDISQMAEDLGVSKTTVSRALSGNGRVSEATRARVVQYAKEKLCAQYAGTRVGNPAVL